MSEARWTPGPWIALPVTCRLHVLDAGKPRYNEGLWAILPRDDQERLPIATADHADDSHPPARKQAEYDARLIAAAPDLYLALADEISDSARLAGPCQAGLVLRCICHDCVRARTSAALAKARGEA